MSEELERTETPVPGPKAWAYCPDCGSSVAGKRFCPACGRVVSDDPAPPPLPAVESAPIEKTPLAPSREASPYLDHPGLAFVAEFVPGLLGFLGLGWLYARRWPVGIGLLLGWWGLLALAAASVLFLFGEICCFLWLPFHVLIPLVSAFAISGDVRQARRRRLMGL